MKLLNKLLVLAVCFMTAHAEAKNDNQNQNDTLADVTGMSCTNGCCCQNGTQTPLGVMTDHIHGKGQWTASYTYMDMNMHGNRIGAAPANDETIYKSYDMSPETMQMQMQMLMVMYGITDRLTIMAMGTFTSNYMTMNMNESMQMTPGMHMTQMEMTQGSVASAYGIGDTKLYGLYSLRATATDRLTATVGLNLPTGSTTTTGLDMYTGSNQRLAYMMQPGTGSYSLLPSLTYVHTISKFSLGAEAGADVKLNNNMDGYRWGNIYNATVWGSYRIFSFLSASLRAEGINAGKIIGADKEILNPYISSSVEFDPTADPKNSGGTSVNAYAGLNLHINKPVLKNFTALFEYGIPVYQDLNGTQPALSNNLLAGVFYRF
jgi:hypothetical protein